MKNIALIGDMQAVRQFLLKLKKYQMPSSPLCFEIEKEKVQLSLPKYAMRVESNAAAVIWFLSDKDKYINQQCVEIIKQLPKQVHIDSYFSQSDEEEPHLFLNSLLRTLPAYKAKLNAKGGTSEFGLGAFYKWGLSLFMPETKTKDSEVKPKLNHFVHTNK